MKAKNTRTCGWKHLYMLLITLILVAMLRRYTRRDSTLTSSSTVSSSQDLFTQSSLSEPGQFVEPSPSSEDRPMESSSSSAEDQIQDPSPSAADQNAAVVAPNDESLSVNPDQGTFEEQNSQETMAAETENKELSIDSPPGVNPSWKDNSDIQNITYSTESQVCNYAKGRWVADSRRPLYSGFGCKRWLSTPWACRLTQKTDFSYEGYRWEPTNCEMPGFDRFAFLTKMQDKTIAFVGDSLGRQQFHSLMCMATGGEDSPYVKDVGSEYGFFKPPGAINPDGWAYRFPTTNTTVLFYWSLTLCKLERINSTDPNSSFALHLDITPTFLTEFLHRFDVLVLNTAHHWTKGKIQANRWVLHVDKKPIENGWLMDMTNVKNFTVHRVVKWLDSQLVFHPELKAFFRTKSPRHFDDSANCKNTVPLTGGSEVFLGGSSDNIVETAVKGTRVNILDITALSELRDEAHKSQYGIFGTSAFSDCLHWCLPGIPDTWNELLVAQL